MRALFNGLAIIGLMSFVGCGPEAKDSVTFDQAPVAQTPPHSHDGPNGGEVIEFTDDHSYHAEVCMDESSRDVTVYIYGASMDTPAAINGDGIEFEIDREGGEEVEIDAEAKPRDGEPEGKSSVFTIAGASIPESAKDLHDFHWHMHIRIDDKEYEAELDHSGHAHAHNHGAEDGEKHAEETGEHKHAEGDGDKGHKEGDGHDKDGDEHGDKEGEGHDKDGEGHGDKEDGDKKGE